MSREELEELAALLRRYVAHHATADTVVSSARHLHRAVNVTLGAQARRTTHWADGPRPGATGAE